MTKGLRNKLIAGLICIVLAFGAFALLNTRKIATIKLASAATEMNTALKLYDVHSTPVGVVNTTVSGNHTAWQTIGCEFDIVGATFAEATSSMTLYFDLASSFGTQSDNVISIDFMKSGQVMVGPAGKNAKMMAAGWSLWLNNNGTSTSQSIAAGANGWVWADFTLGGLTACDNNLHVKAGWDVGRSELNVVLTGSGITGSQTITIAANAGVLNTTTSGKYYPTVWFQRKNVGDSITIDNFKVHEVDTTLFEADFSDEGEVCYGWTSAHKFSQSLCVNTTYYEYVHTGFNMPELKRNSTGIRLDNNSGIRWLTLVGQDAYDAIVKEVGEANVELGHVLIPTSFGYDALSPLTINSANAVKSVGVNIVNKDNNVGGTLYRQYSCVLTGTPNNDYNTGIDSVAYIKITNPTTGEEFIHYSNMYSNISLSGKASEVYAQRSATKTGSYIYLTPDGDYSPYTDEQRSKCVTFAPSSLAGTDFVVEVPAGEKPLVLQLTDIQIIDATQKHYPGRLSGWSDTLWRPENLYDLAWKYTRATISQVETTYGKKPDLIVLSGDNTYGEFDYDFSMIDALIAEMDSYNIPWAMTYGNHDREAVTGKAYWTSSYNTTTDNTWDSKYTKVVSGSYTLLKSFYNLDDLNARYYNSKNCLYTEGTVTGDCNYTVGLIQGGKLINTVYLMDSHGCSVGQDSFNGIFASYATGVYANGGQPIIYTDQQNWFQTTQDNIKTIAGNGAYVPAIGFWHHPIHAWGYMARWYGFANNGGEWTGHIGEESFTDFRVQHVIEDLFSVKEGDNGCFHASINDSQFVDKDDVMHNKFVATGVLGWFFGHEHRLNATVTQDGVKYGFGVKASRFDAHVGSDYGDAVNEVGGTLIDLSSGISVSRILVDY